MPFSSEQRHQRTMVSKPLVGLTSACGKGIALVSLLPHPERATFSLDPCEQGEAWHSYNGYVFNFEEKLLVQGNKTVREENYLSLMPGGPKLSLKPPGGTSLHLGLWWQALHLHIASFPSSSASGSERFCLLLNLFWLCVISR